MYIGAATMETMRLSSKTENKNYHMVQQFHFAVFFSRIEETLVRKIYVLLCSLKRHLQPRGAKIWKEPQFPSTDESKRKKWCVHTHTHTHTHTQSGILLSNTKKNEILSLSTTWMDLEGVMPSKTMHTEKDKYHTILFTCGTAEIK